MKERLIYAVIVIFLAIVGSLIAVGVQDGEFNTLKCKQLFVEGDEYKIRLVDGNMAIFHKESNRMPVLIGELDNLLTVSLMKGNGGVAMLGFTEGKDESIGSGYLLLVNKEGEKVYVTNAAGHHAIVDHTRKLPK